MSRIDKVNSVLLRELAQLVEENIYLENALITISYVECSSDLRYAKIGVSVLPDKMSLPAIKKLKNSSSEFTRILRKKLKIRYIPKFNWQIDEREKYAQEIEQAIQHIKD